MPLVIFIDLVSRCIGAHDDVDTRAGFCQVVQREPSTGFGGDDDDDQIIQCLQHVKDA
jgi:hypothetical protein